MDVVSEYGSGSDFFFTVWQGIRTSEKMGDFHAVSNQAEDVSKKVYQCDYVAPDAHVLVVEDNEINQIVLQAILEPLKIQLDFAENGKEAQWLVAQPCPTLCDPVDCSPPCCPSASPRVCSNSCPLTQ